jgi:hypothetical protein
VHAHASTAIASANLLLGWLLRLNPRFMIDV